MVLGTLGRMLAPAGARCVCQELFQLAGTAGTVPPWPSHHPQPTRGALPWGAVAAGESRAVPGASTAPGELPVSPSTVPAVPVPCVLCHPRAVGWAGLSWAGPALPWGSRGRAKGGGTDWAERGTGQGTARAGAVSGAAGAGQPWGGREHSRAPAVEATAGTNPARGFGVSYLFSKGTGRRFFSIYMI